MLGHFPFAEGIVCLGFFAVYLFEELGELLMHRGQATKKNKKKNPGCARTLPADNPVVATSDLDEDNYKLKQVTVSNGQPSDNGPGSLLEKNDGSARSKRVEEGSADDSDHESHHGHGHSHGPPILDLEQKSVAAAIRGFLLVFALSFHSIFEGMAIGLQPSTKDIWFLFAAVTVHELAIMFCIGLEMLASNIRVKIYIVYMVTLGLITPLGVIIGIVVTEYFQDPTPSHTLTIGVLQGVAAGTLLYVTFLEVLERERRKHGNGLIKLLAVFLGFILLSGLEALGGELSKMRFNPIQTKFHIFFFRSWRTTG